MKIIQILFTFMILNSTLQICHAQSGTWTWMQGDNTINSAGNNGMKGVPSPLNEPASRYGCGYWTDTIGNLWIYSGLNASDDLWKFDAQALQWTWMTGGAGTEVINTLTKGVYDPLNDPGALAYGMPTWTTPDNHLWLFGGLHNYGSENMNNDLWQYNPVLNQWAWMGTFGPANYGTIGVGGDSTTVPGGRQEGNSTWTDGSGNLWLFGGCDETYQSYNDVWEYNVTTGIWTWMSGSSNLNGPGQYGVIGQPWYQNYPSGRSTNLFWKDEVGDFWLAGGTQHQNDLMFQDVWEFNPQNLYWTWVNGPIGEDTVMFGTDCLPGTMNQAGPRFQNQRWQVCFDFVVTYNGFPDWKDSTIAGFNDMWGYKSSTNEWTKINSWPIAGNYGSKGVTSPGNAPPARIGGASFISNDKSLWLFGGQNNNGFFNDVWKYVLDTVCIGGLSCASNCNLAPPVISADKNTFCASDSAQLCVPTGYNYYEWNTGLTGVGNCVVVKQTGDYYVVVTSTGGCTAQSNSIHIIAIAAPSVFVTTHGDTLVSSSAVNYQWYLNNDPVNGATAQGFITNAPGSYTVQITDSNGCTGISNTVVLTGINDLTESENISLYPNPSTGSWQLTVGDELIGGKLEVYDDNGRLVFQSAIRDPKSAINLNVEKGIYYLRISNTNVSIVRKLVKI